MPRSVRNTVLSTMKPTTRDRKNTKVLSTPWIRVRVTMSPLETWVISWPSTASTRSEEHTSELQSHSDLVCRLLLEKKKKNDAIASKGDKHNGSANSVTEARTHPIVPNSEMKIYCETRMRNSIQWATPRDQCSTHVA